MKRLILSIFFAGYCYGLTLEEALSTAEQNNKEILSLRQQLNSSQLQLKGDENLYLPTVFAKTSLSAYGETPTSKIPGFPVGFKQANRQFANVNFGINQTIYSGGQISSKVDISKYNVEATKALYKEKLSQLKAETTKAYIDVFVSDSMIDIYKKQLEALQSIYRQAEGFFEAGLITKVDLLQTRVRLAEVQRDLTQAESSKRVAISRLSQLIGKDVSEEIFLPVSISVGDILDFNSLLKEAYEKRGIVQYYRWLLKQSEKLEDIERADFLPKVFAQAEYIYTSQNPYLDPKGNLLFTLGATVQFQGLASYYRILKTRSDTSKIKYEFDNLKENIKLELKTAYENFLVSKENYRVSVENFEYAKEYFELVKQQYENQLATSTDLLNAESALTRAQQSKEINYYNMLKAYIDIKRIVGEF